MTPSELDFGEQAVGTSVTEALTVLNAGDDTLTVSGAALDDASARYAVVADGGLVLAPGDTTTFLVGFTPTTQGHAAAALMVPPAVIDGWRALKRAADPAWILGRGVMFDP